jgi:hypothetical protein
MGVKAIFPKASTGIPAVLFFMKYAEMAVIANVGTDDALEGTTVS